MHERFPGFGADAGGTHGGEDRLDRGRPGREGAACLLDRDLRVRVDRFRRFPADAPVPLADAVRSRRPDLKVEGRLLWNERSARLKLVMPCSGKMDYDVPGMKKKPSTSELLDWLKLLMVEDISVETLRERDPKRLIPPLHGALIKNEQDVHLFERLAFMTRREGR